MSRQKLLLAVVGVLVLLQAGDWTLTHMIEGPKRARQARTAQYQKAIQERRKQLTALRGQFQTLAQWESQSLPANADVARSLYRSWLLDLVGKVHLSNRRVEVNAAVNRRGLYQAITGTVRGSGSTEQVVQFLHEFYSANHLHRIASLSLAPVKNSSRLDALISVEALILPTTDRVDRLASGHADRLAWASINDYAPIVQRNFFGFQQKRIDLASFVFLTAVTQADGQPEAWFTLRNVDKTLKLKTGETLTAGGVTGTIVQILDSEVILDTGGERWLLAVGDQLAEALALPPEF